MLPRWFCYGRNGAEFAAGTVELWSAGIGTWGEMPLNSIAFLFNICIPVLHMQLHRVLLPPWVHRPDFGGSAASKLPWMPEEWFEESCPWPSFSTDGNRLTDSQASWHVSWCTGSCMSHIAPALVLLDGNYTFKYILWLHAAAMGSFGGAGIQAIKLSGCHYVPCLPTDNTQPYFICDSFAL